MVVALMPSFGQDPDRLAHQAFVIRHYHVVWGIPTVVGSDTADRRGRFSRAKAINNAARAAVNQYPQATTFVLCDNDTIPDQNAFALSLQAAEHASAAMPHSRIRDLSRDATSEYKRTGIITGYADRGVACLSYLVVSRSAFALVNGMDELFRGWGAEDTAFYYAIERQVGPIGRFDGVLVHLWHQVDASRRDSVNLRRNRARARRYRAATALLSRHLSRQYGSLGI